VTQSDTLLWMMVLTMRKWMAVVIRRWMNLTVMAQIATRTDTF